MYEQEVLQLVKANLAYMGTVDGNRPRVRPMKPYIDREGHIWLFSRFDTRKVAELENNPRVELCFVGQEQEVLTLYGRVKDDTKHGSPTFRALRDMMFAEIPEMKNFFSEQDLNSLIIYRFVLHEIRYWRPSGEFTTRVNLPMKQDPDIELNLCQGGFCLMP
ncbi:MAG: pyridoxamine 5'-phosphate oxidase family protein [Negativicutes bacterium]|nr:pyridoxamine 5'-phosphate oxidase family protein [Negativicutes bacterium]